jgi:hypothetical protein
MAALAAQRPGVEFKLEVVRKDGGKTEDVTVKLGEYTEDIPDEKAVAKEASKKQALEPRKTVAPIQPQPKVNPPAEINIGNMERTNGAGDHKFYVYVPDAGDGKYDPQKSYGVLVWLHPPAMGTKEQIIRVKKFWESSFCDKYGWIFIAPVAEDPKTGWVGSDAETIREAVETISKEYTVDPKRVAIHGMDQGGDFAFYMSFHARDVFRQCIAVGAAMGNQVKPTVQAQPLSLFIVVGNKDPLLPQIQETKTKLDKEKYPLTYREIPDMAHQYLTNDLADKTYNELLRWLDCLDRI